MRNRGKQRLSPCETGVEDSPLALQSPRVGEGASGTVSAFGHSLLRASLDGQASGGQGGVTPCIPHQGAPGPGEKNTKRTAWIAVLGASAGWRLGYALTPHEPYH